MQDEHEHFHANIFLKLALDGDQPQLYWLDHLLAADGCLFWRQVEDHSKQKTIKNDDYVVVAHLAIAEIQAAKTLSFLVHIADMFECLKERLC